MTFPYGVYDPFWNSVIFYISGLGNVGDPILDSGPYALPFTHAKPGNPLLLSSAAGKPGNPSAGAGTAMAFNGTDFLSLSGVLTAAGLNLIPGDFTYEMWIRGYRIDSGSQVIISWGTATGEGGIVGAVGYFNLASANNPNHLNVNINAPVTDTVNWHHHVFQRSGNLVQYGVDGQLNAKITLTTNVGFSILPVIIGSYNFASGIVSAENYAAGIRLTKAARYTFPFAPGYPYATGSAVSPGTSGVVLSNYSMPLNPFGISQG